MKNSFEKKFSKYAIQNLSLYLLVCYGVGYILTMINSDLLVYLTLEPALILQGQIWRLVTWILIPPPTSNLFFMAIMLYAYYSFGTALERAWGAYRYNCYLFSGMLFTVMGSFALYLIWGVVGGGFWFSTYYVNMSIFLAFAATFPDAQVLFMYILPVKVKHMGIIYGIYLVLECILGGLVSRIVIGASMLNFLLFFITFRRTAIQRISPEQAKRRQEFKSQVRHTARITRHKCAVCGRTEETNPELEFRFCSKCNGNFEYCQDHLFTHKHVE